MIFGVVNRLYRDHVEHQRRRKIALVCSLIVEKYGYKKSYSKKQINKILDTVKAAEVSEISLVIFASRDRGDINSEECRRAFSQTYLENKMPFNAKNIIEVFAPSAIVRYAQPVQTSVPGLVSVDSCIATACDGGD